MSKDSNKTIVYSALEVANICGVVNQTAINWIRNGYLTAFSTPGGQYRVYLDDLIDFMQKRKMRVPADLMEVYNQSKKVVNGILVVDDDRGLNHVVTKFLEKQLDNIAFYQAFDGFEAGAILADKKPGIVLLDLDLPGVNGEDLCQRIHNSEEFGKPAVCVMTALQEDGLENRLKSLGAVEYFRKPLNLEDLLSAVKKFL